MQNPYIKQYPDLMDGKKIMYIHGFMSSAQSGTVSILQTLLPNATVVADDIPLDPVEAVTMLQEMARRESPDLIIGTSMGGMYAEMLHGYDRILVNPALEMGQTMQKSNMMGKQVFQNPRRDGVQEVVVTKALVKEYADITTRCFAAVDGDEQRLPQPLSSGYPLPRRAPTDRKGGAQVSDTGDKVDRRPAGGPHASRGADRQFDHERQLSQRDIKYA